MAWENSDKITEIINPDDEKVLRICYCDIQGNSQDEKVQTIYFYKVESGKTQEIAYVSYPLSAIQSSDQSLEAPEVEFVVRFSSPFQINGQREWKFKIGYLVPTSMLTIYI